MFVVCLLVFYESFRHWQTSTCIILLSKILTNQRKIIIDESSNTLFTEKKTIYQMWMYRTFSVK